MMLYQKKKEQFQRNMSCAFLHSVANFAHLLSDMQKCVWGGAKNTFWFYQLRHSLEISGFFRFYVKSVLRILEVQNQLF